MTMARRSPGETARWFAYVFVALDYLAVGAMRTVLPFMAAHVVGQTRGGVGALDSLYGVGQVTGALVMGRVSDKYGRRGVLLTSFFGSALGYGLSTAALVLGSPRLLYASRLPVGLAKQTVTTCRAVISDCAEGKERSAAMAHLFGATCAGYAVGPFVGGFLVDVGARRRVKPVIPALCCCAIYLFLLIPLASFALPETANAKRGPKKHDDDKEEEQKPRSLSPSSAPVRETPAWRQPGVLRLVGACACPEAAVVIGSTAVPLLTRQFSWTASRVGFLNSCFGLGGGLIAWWPVAPWLRSGRITDGAATLLGAICLACGALVVASGGTPAALWVSLPFYVLAIALLRTSPATLITRCAPDGTHGEALGLLDASNSAVRIVAPLLAAAWADRRGTARGAFECQALAASLGVLMLLASGTALTFADASRRHPKKDI
mmetsp:Transcript_27868/g.89877  ORF Transcript_27868/g.89877 Transcript_27868/m.89877 type:complete len:434 (+) Transcript_27868:53-1354(+)